MTQRKICIIEDHPDQLFLFERLLSKSGYLLYPARTAATGLDIIQNIAVKVVLLDIGLPDKSGLDVLRFIRTLPEAERPRVVVISGDSNPRTMQEAAELGANKYFVKPYVRERRLSTIAECFTVSKNKGTARPDIVELSRRIWLNTETSSLFYEGDQIRCPPSGFKILVHLFKKRGTPVSKTEIAEIMALDRGDKIDSYISRLRKALGPHGKLIRTVRGKGYQVDRP